jgi:hypothetical protein
MKPGKALCLATSLWLVGLSGAEADCGPSAGVAIPKVPPAAQRYVAGQQGPSGGAGGEYCDTNDVHPAFRLASINVQSGSTIDSIGMTFDIPLGDVDPRDRGVPAEKLCGGTGGSAKQPALTLAPKEYIVRVSGHYGNTVDSLYIQTSAPQFRNFGVQNPTSPGSFDYIAPEGMVIAALVVKACTFVDAVGVILQPRPR